MRIAITMGFFLPVPPAAGGATEKTWHRLAIEFARRGHEVTVISRTWREWPREEVRDGVRHLRLPGFDHTRHLSRNLLRDARWSLRVRRSLPAADVVVANSVTLPMLGAKRGPASARLVVMTGRIPKGQFRFYRGVDRVLAVSSVVLERVRRENPSAAERALVTGYPINWALLSRDRPARNAPLTVGFIGRLHREKGLHLLASAVREMATLPDLPRWQLLLCGPSDVARGGSGAAYVTEVTRTLREIPGGPRVEIREPVFDERALADTYREIDVFCYPSVSANGETFGVAVAEAMAAGAVPVVSSLPCFGDYLEPGGNGDVFDHTARDAGSRLARAIADLLRDPARRARMAASARESVRRFDTGIYAERLLTDFSALNRTAGFEGST